MSAFDQEKFEASKQRQRWIDDLADKICLEWDEWQAEADFQSQVEQDSRAGEFYLQNKVINAIEKALAKLDVVYTNSGPIFLPGIECPRCHAKLMHTRIHGYRCPRGCK